MNDSLGLQPRPAAVARRGVERIAEYPPCSRCGFVAVLEAVTLGGVDDEYWAYANARESAYRVHVAHETAELLASTPLDKLRQRYDVAAIRLQFGSWAVTTYGVECLITNYAIERKRLFESDWSHHMAEKVWVVLEDFESAIRAARRLYPLAISPKLRFEIFRRDGYRCQICGLSAPDGAILHVDHKVPRTKGGNNSSLNLWTLCSECNIGKRAMDL